MKLLSRYFYLLLIPFILFSCTGQNVKKTPIEKILQKPRDLAAMEKVNKSEKNYIRDALGISKKKKSKNKNSFEDKAMNPLAYNQYLWKASLNILSSFTSLSTVNEKSGIISTNWQTSKNNSSLRYKITALINSTELNLNSLNINVYKQTLKNAQWVDMPVKSSMSAAIKKKIYLKAKSFNKKDL